MKSSTLHRSNLTKERMELLREIKAQRHTSNDNSPGIYVRPAKENELDLYKKVGIDEECLDLCYALNHLPGVITLESCCGHCKDLYRIWFRCTNTVTLAILSRSVCRR